MHPHVQMEGQYQNDLKEIVCEDADWIKLFQEKVQ